MNGFIQKSFLIIIFFIGNASRDLPEKLVRYFVRKLFFVDFLDILPYALKNHAGIFLEISGSTPRISLKVILKIPPEVFPLIFSEALSRIPATVLSEKLEKISKCLL